MLTSESFVFESHFDFRFCCAFLLFRSRTLGTCGVTSSTAPCVINRRLCVVEEDTGEDCTLIMQQRLKTAKNMKEMQW